MGFHRVQPNLLDPLFTIKIWARALMYYSTQGWDGMQRRPPSKLSTHTFCTFCYSMHLQGLWYENSFLFTFSIFASLWFQNSSIHFIQTEVYFNFATSMRKLWGIIFWVIFYSHRWQTGNTGMRILDTQKRGKQLTQTSHLPNGV